MLHNGHLKVGNIKFCSSIRTFTILVNLFVANDCRVPGAPLICQGPNGHAVLVGIESWSSGERGEPVVYTKMETNDMAGWLNWMKAHAPHSTGASGVTLDSPFG